MTRTKHLTTLLVSAVLGCTSPETVAPGRGALAGRTVMTHHDMIPNFAFGAGTTSVRDGAWSDTATWSTGAVPGATDSVLITHTVTFDATSGTARNVGIDEAGVLRFRTDASTRLSTGNLEVLPGGTLEIGTTAAPIGAAVNAEIVIRDVPIDMTADPSQYGTGLIGLGTVTMHGAPKGPTFVRLTRAPGAGDTTFDVAESVTGWRAGDQIVVPDSRQVSTESGGPGGRETYQHLEVVDVTSVSADGRTITFSPALAHAHPGTTDENDDGAPDYLPHIANLTRNVIVRSENRAGTRGQVLFTGTAAIDVRYVAFEGLGRTTFDDLDATTNRIGRYSLHAHHLTGPNPPIDPEYQYRFVGNSIYEDAPTTPREKWGITIHDSHYGLIRDNVVYNVAGAGIITEDGSESFNVFDHNFVVRVTSNGGRDEHMDATRGIGREGVGFWFRGPNNYIRNNVAVNMGEESGDIEASYGFKFNMVYLGDIAIPRFRGAMTHMAGEFDMRDGNSMPLLEFSNNEAYGQIQGLTLWWLCTHDFVPSAGCGHSVLRDTVIWHASRYAFYGYPAYNFEFNGTRVYGDPAALSTCCEFRSVFFYGDYGTTDMLVTNSEFYNTGGYTPPYFRDGSIRVENSHFRTESGVIHLRSAAPGSCSSCDLPDADVVLVNNTFDSPAGKPLRTITMGDHTPTDPANRDRLFACNHNGVVGDNFEVFFADRPGAPCATTRPDVEDGFVCPTAASAAACAGVSPPDVTPPSTPLGLTATAVSSSEIMLSWTASTDDVAIADYELLRCIGAACDPVATTATVIGTMHLDNGLLASTLYRYRVRATDTSGNDSMPSNVAEATTLSMGTTGPDGGVPPGSDGGSTPRPDGSTTSPPPTDDGGCGCTVPGEPKHRADAWALATLVALGLVCARRYRVRRRAGSR